MSEDWKNRYMRKLSQTLRFAHRLAASVDRIAQLERELAEARAERDRWKLECQGMGRTLASGIVISSEEYRQLRAQLEKADALAATLAKIEDSCFAHNVGPDTWDNVLKWSGDALDAYRAARDGKGEA